MTLPALVPKGDDRALWLRLPASGWIWIYGLMIETLLEEMVDAKSEEWRKEIEQRTHEDLVHQGRVLLAVREVIEQAAPPPQHWEAVKGLDELRDELFRIWAYEPTPVDRAFVKDLVVDPDRDYPVALERLRKAMQEELSRPRSA